MVRFYWTRPGNESDWLLLNWSCDISGNLFNDSMASRNYSFGSTNPWSSNDTLLGIRLGDPHSGLVLARRHGLLPHHVLESSHHQEQVPEVCVVSIPRRSKEGLGSSPDLTYN